MDKSKKTNMIKQVPFSTFTCPFLSSLYCNQLDTYQDHSTDRSDSKSYSIHSEKLNVTYLVSVLNHFMPY